MSAYTVAPPVRSPWIRQPPKSRLCGQIAVAVVAGISLMESIERFGHRKGTTTAQVVRVLRDLGFETTDRLVRRQEPPSLAIAKLRSERGGNWHWVVIDGPYVWDGAWGTPDGTVEWPEHLRVTSYLPITEGAT